MGKQNNTVKFGVPGFFDCSGVPGCSGVPVFPGFSTTQGSLSWLSCREIMVQIIFCCSFPRISGKSENCCDFFSEIQTIQAPTCQSENILLGGSVMSLVVAACVKFSRQFPYWTVKRQKQGLVLVCHWHFLKSAISSFFDTFWGVFSPTNNLKILWVRWSSFTDVSLKTSRPESEPGGYVP